MISLTIINVLIVIIAILASIIDIKTKKIPNYLNFGGALLGVVLNTLNRGFPGLFISLLAYIIAVIIMIVLDPKHKVGYGDVKLMGCIGAFIGPKLILITWFFYAFLFGFYSVIRIALSLPWRKLCWDYILAKQTKQAFVFNFDKTNLNNVLKSRISLAPFIALSLIITLTYGEFIIQMIMNPKP